MNTAISFGGREHVVFAVLSDAWIEDLMIVVKDASSSFERDFESFGHFWRVSPIGNTNMVFELGR